MLRKLKKFVAIVFIIVSVPYILTVFINGKTVKETESAQDHLLQEHCIAKLAQEVSSDYEEEMLKVQAILVRTSVYKEVEELGKAYLEQEEFENTEKIDPLWKKKLEEVWKATEGQVILYNNELALVPFHQVSNGKTRNGQEVLGVDTYPYLQVKECPKDVEAVNQMASTFIDATGVKVESYDSAGYALQIKVGEETYSGENFRDTYQLASSCVEIQDFTENTRVITKGVGHGLGLSQYTANEMAKEGKTAAEILAFFFEGTEIKEVAEILWEIE